MENESKQNVCLASCITSVDVNHSVIQLESCRSTITIKNLLHFLEYFNDKINYMKNSLLGFANFQSTHLSSVSLCTNAERFEWEKIVQVLSAILSLVTWPGLFAGLLNHRILQALWKWIAFRSCCSKTAENEENVIKLDASPNSRTINSLHQVNIMLFELDLRMLL